MNKSLYKNITFLSSLIKRINYFNNILNYSDNRLKKDLILVFFLGVLNAVIDVLSLILLSILTNKFLNLESTNNIIMFFDKLFAGFIFEKLDLLIFTIFILICSTFLKLIFLFSTTNIAFKSGVRFVDLMINNTIGQDYENIIKSNRNDALASIYKKSDEYILTLVLPLAIFSGSLIMILGIIIGLFFLVSNIFIPIGLFVILSYFLIFVLVRKKLKLNSIIISDYTNRTLLVLKKIFNSLKEIKINSHERLVSKNFSSLNMTLKLAQAENMVISQAPRYLIEILLLFIVIMLIALYENSLDLLKSLKISDLVLVIFTGLKLIPLFQRLFWSVAKITGQSQVFHDIFSYIKPVKKLDLTNNIYKFTNNYLIELKDIMFSFSKDFTIFEKFNLKIKHNSKVLIKGPSGSGKSTLLDLIIGFRNPIKGKIFRSARDKKDWLEKISIVSSDSFFINQKIKEHVHGDLKHLDEDKITKILKDLNFNLKQIDSTNLLDFYIGEDGDNLSYGQQRKLSIARALYKEPKLLILDEATNGLDKKSEKEVLNHLINNQNLTLILVTHKDIDKQFFDLHVKLT